MEDKIAKERIINDLKQMSLNKPVTLKPTSQDSNSDIFKLEDEDNEVIFAQNFLANEGKFILCETEHDLVDNMQLAVKKYGWNNIYCNNQTVANILDATGISYCKNINPSEEINVAVTLCECLIARHGSILISTNNDNNNCITSNSRNLVILATIAQIVPDIKSAFEFLKKKYSDSIPPTVTMISGTCNSTAVECNIEKLQHGVQNIYLFLLADQ